LYLSTTKRELVDGGCQLNSTVTLPPGNKVMLEYVRSVGAFGLSSSEQYSDYKLHRGP